MGTFGHEPERASLRNLGLVCLAAFGLAACVTFVWLGMRAVMDIGGACAEGGPFVPVQRCPDVVPFLLMTGMFGLFGFGALGIYAGAQVGGDWAALPLLGWPALFLSLGWNFLEYGFTAGGEEGLVWGWIIPGVIFVLMGGIPLWIVVATRGSDTPVAARFGMPTAGGSRPEPRPSLGWDTSHRASTAPTGAKRALAASAAPVSGTLDRARDDESDAIDRLERLADLRRRGDISTDEFERFKRALLLDAERRS
jgi:hypothetical protein